MPRRICSAIARWVLETARGQGSLDYALIELAEVDLPFVDEPVITARGRYEHEHTKRCSRIVRSYDGFRGVEERAGFSLRRMA